MTTGPRPEGDALGARVGELRRLTIMFCDLVGSTELSSRLEPEAYRDLLTAYHAACREVIEERFEGRIVELKGDGALSTFGYPAAHENDAERAVRAGLALVRAVHELSRETSTATGETLDVRVAVHHGPVYLDFEAGDIFGLTANVGSRLHGLAEPGTVVVSEEVRELVEQHFEIGAGDPQHVKGIAEPLTPFRIDGERRVPAPRSWSTPLVEREGELERLAALWAGAGSGDRPAAALVHGEAGVGKSRLVAAFLEDACTASEPVVWLHGSPFHLDAGFHPVRVLLEARCGAREDAGEGELVAGLRREVLELGLDPAQSVSLLAPVMGLHPSAGYEQASTVGRKLEEQVAQAVLDYLIASTRRGPAILVVENLHWFDEATREVIASLLRAGPASLLVIATSRGPERGPWEPIELQQLSFEGRLALIDELAGTVSSEHRLALATRSGGIPLYVEELVRAGPGQHSIRAAVAAPVPGSVPEVLYEPLVARLYATPRALGVAGVAAAAGLEVDRSLLAETMSISGDDVDSSLRTLVDARILEPVEDRAARFRFRHELLREVAYELQPPSWRRRVHDRLSDVLAREDSVDWHVLALHYERADRHMEAAAALEQTADWSRRRGALDQARADLERAIELVEPLTTDPARDHREVELRLRRGFLAMSAEGVASPEASADFDRCLDLAAADPRGDDMFSTLISLWAYYLSRAELDRARQVSVTLREALDGGRDVFRPQNLAGFGMLDWFAGSFSGAVDTLTAATGDLALMGDEPAVSEVWFVPNDPTVAMHVHLALARFMAGDPGAEESLDRAREVATSLGFPQGPWSVAYANWLGSWLWIESGRLDLAAEAVSDLQSSSARHGFDGWELIAALHSAALEGLTALEADAPDVDALAEHADTVGALIDVWEGLELRVFLPFYLTTAGALLAAAGEEDDARRRYEESLDLSARTGMRFYDAETRRRLAKLEHDPGAAAAGLRAALDLARAQAARPFELRIELDLQAASR